MRWLFAVAALGVVAAGCVDREAQDQAAKTRKIVTDPVQVVRVLPARQTNLVETVEITGEIATSDDTNVGAKVPGKVVAVYVKEGDSVVAGQVIASLEATQQLAQLNQARASVNSAQAQLQAAQSTLAQAIKNAAVNPTRTSSQVRAAEAQVRQAKAQLDKALAGARPQERAQAELAVRNARSGMETARKELERVEKLVSEGALPQSRLDQARNGFTAAQTQHDTVVQSLELIRAGARDEDIAAARAAVAQAEESLRSAKATKELDNVYQDQVNAARAQVNNVRAQIQSAQAQVTLAQQALADTQIRAPFSGKISGKPVQPGAVVGAGSPVARIVGGQDVYFEGLVPERQIEKVAPGAPVQVTITSLNQTLSGTVAAINPMGENIGRQFKVRVSIPGAPREVRPGMFARGKLQLGQVPDATVVPASAVVSQGDEHFLMIAENGEAKRVPVKLGLSQGSTVQVIGVPLGAQIIVEGQTNLTEGAKVRIEEAQVAGA